MTQKSVPADEVRFFSGSSNKPLAKSIASALGVPLDETHISHRYVCRNDKSYKSNDQNIVFRHFLMVLSR